MEMCFLQFSPSVCTTGIEIVSRNEPFHHLLWVVGLLGDRAMFLRGPTCTIRRSNPVTEETETLLSAHSSTGPFIEPWNKNGHIQHNRPRQSSTVKYPASRNPNRSNRSIARNPFSTFYIILLAINEPSTSIFTKKVQLFLVRLLLFPLFALSKRESKIFAAVIIPVVRGPTTRPGLGFHHTC